MNKKIYLIGFMGSGKSSVAKVLRQNYGLEYVDTDKEIMSRTDMTINEYFEKFGEAEFRKLETKVLLDVSQNDLYQVISCGGGVALKEENIKIMREYGTVIWLYCEPKKTLKRVKRNNNRPILKDRKDLKSITDMMNEREPYYKKACHIKIDEGRNSLYRTCKEIINLVYV